MQTTQFENISKKELKIAKRELRTKKLSELRDYYKKEDNLSKSRKKYTNLVKADKEHWRDRSIIAFKEEGNKTILWPVGVK